MGLTLRRKLESETIRIPEAAAMIGQNVRITIEVEDGVAVTPPAGRDMAAFDAFAERVRVDGSAFDLDAVEELRLRSRL